MRKMVSFIKQQTILWYFLYQMIIFFARWRVHGVQNKKKAGVWNCEVLHKMWVNDIKFCKTFKYFRNLLNLIRSCAKDTHTGETNGCKRSTLSQYAVTILVEAIRSQHRKNTALWCWNVAKRSIEYKIRTIKLRYYSV